MSSFLSCRIASDAEPAQSVTVEMSEHYFNHQDLGNWIKTYMELSHSNKIVERNLLSTACKPSIEEVIGKTRAV